MLKYILLLRQFKTKYLILHREDIIIDCILLFILQEQMTVMKLLVFLTTLPTVFTIGSIVSLKRASLDHGEEKVQGVPDVFSLYKRNNYVKTYCIAFENLASTKISGMGCFSHHLKKCSAVCLQVQEC